ncbi:MAG: choice-of-anchor M domain-containing protein [Microbacterium sp.]
MHVSSRLRIGALVSALVLAAGLTVPTAALAAVAPAVKDDPILIDTGHVDAFNLVLNEDDSVRLVLKEDVTGSHVLRTPESVELFIKSQSIVTGLPAVALPPGAPADLYHLPITQDNELLWPGWDTQSVQAAYPGAKTEFDVAVAGPGDVFIWTQGPFGDPRSLLVGGGYKLPATINQPFPAHTHANWGFTEPGAYSFTVTARVTSADGTRTSTSNTAEYSFTVAPAPETLAVTGAENPVDAGSQLTLTAAQAPASSTFSAYQWQTRASADAEWADVAGATAVNLTVTAAEGAQYRALISGGRDFSTGAEVPLTVTSQPVTIAIKADPVVPQIGIAPLSHHYHSGSPIKLTLTTTTPDALSGDIRWYLQREDQDAPVALGGAAGPTHSLTAEQALHGAKVTAELVGESGAVLATAPARTIDVDDHGAAPLQKVAIQGLAGQYESGETATLTATVTPASVLNRYEWYVQEQGETSPTLVPGENDADLSFEVTEQFSGAAVIARLTYDDGRAYSESAPVIIKVHDPDEIPATDLMIETNRDEDDYWTGQTATLTAKQSTATGLTAYRWLAKLPGTSEFTAVDGQTAEQYKFKPTLTNSGVQVKVQLLLDGEIHAESDAVTITAQVRPVVTTLTVSGDKQSYAPGDTAQLTSAQTPQTDEAHYHWYVKRAGASDFVWVDQSRDKDLDYPVTAEDAGAQLVVRLFDDTHAIIAESAPYTLTVANGGSDPDPVTVLTIEGVASGYYVGETAGLTAVQTPATAENHYHWFIKRSGDADYSVISGALTGSLAHEVAEADAGALIVAKLYNHDHEVIAESTPATITVLPGSPKPTTAPAAQTEAALEGIAAGGITPSSTSVVAGQVITVQVGEGSEHAGEWVAAWLFSDPVLLTSDWIQVTADGTIAVTIPAGTPAGAHRLAVFDSTGALIGWQQLQVGAAAGAGAGSGSAAGNASGGGLAVTGAEFGGYLTAGSLLLLIGAGVLFVARRRSAAAIDAAE